MILHMIQLNPDERLSAEGYLQSYAGIAFPNYFSPFLHNLYSCLSSLDSDARVIKAFVRSYCFQCFCDLDLMFYIGYNFCRL